MTHLNVPPESPVENHTRINNTIINTLEKKVLHWLAARMPPWIVPDTLTLTGLLASVLIFASYGLTYFDKRYLWLASVGFVIHWFGDSLDGTLARYRKTERPKYGFFIDHMLDSISVVLIFIGLGLSPFLRFDLAMIALVSYLLASIYVYLTTYVNGVFRISYGGISPTEIRLIAIAANAVVFFTENPPISLPWVTLTLFDLIVIGVTVIILTLLLFSTITTAMELSKSDREKRRAQKLTERIARKQALRDQRAARRAAAQAVRRSKIKMQIE